MTRNRIIISILALALSMNVVVGTKSAMADTLRKGTPVGTTVSGKIDEWDLAGSSGYGTNTIYDVRLTVLRVVRGYEAWNLIQKASETNKPPETGFEYILAHIRIAFNAAENKVSPYTLKPEVFKVYDTSDHAYACPNVLPPKPALIGKVFYPGDSSEGWVPFLVSKEHERPFMFFTGGLWFQLFYE
jgi:hypothetical protein